MVEAGVDLAVETEGQGVVTVHDLDREAETVIVGEEVVAQETKADRYGRGGGDRDRDRGRQSRDRRPEHVPEYDWKSRSSVRLSTDVMPVPGMEPPPVAVVGGQSNSFGAGISKDVIRGDNFTSKAVEAGKRRVDTSSSTRHARRLYVGNIPRNTKSDEVADFLIRIIVDGLPSNSPDLPVGSLPVLNMNILLINSLDFVNSRASSWAPLPLLTSMASCSPLHLPVSLEI